MAPSFHDREQAFEAKYAHDQEFRFLVTARRDKLMAGWAADRHAMSASARERLTQAVISTSDRLGHDRAVLDVISSTLAAYGNAPDEAELLAAMQLCVHRAERELLEGSRPS